MVTDCNESATGELVIPSELEGKPVVKIGSSAFLNCISLTSVTIPARVTKIEWGAFSGCSQLTDIYDKGDEEDVTKHDNSQVPDGIPFLGGNEFKIGLDALPVDLKASESGFYVGFNVKFDDDEKDPLKEVKKSINTARKYGSMPVDAATANTVQAQSVDTESVLFDLYDASQYTVESQGYLRNESAWQGDLVSLFAADANTSLTPLLEQTYRNAQPTLAVAGDTLYAAFLRGDAETNPVAVCISKFTGSGWTDPVQVDETAILDDAPTLCAADGTLWLAYARTTEKPNGDLLAYAQKQSIVVGKLDPETLSLTDQAVYQGFAHLQTMTVVDGQPVLVWADSAVTDENSVLFSPSSTIYAAAFADGAWSEAQAIAQVERPVLSLTAGESDGVPAAERFPCRLRIRRKTR